MPFYSDSELVLTSTFMRELADDDLKAIIELHDRWLEEELAGNEAHIISFCTESVRWMPPGVPPLEGKEAIAEYLENNRVDLQEVTFTRTTVQGNDSVAYLMSDFSARYFTQDSSEIHESTGMHLWILRKEAEVWRVAVVAWSSW